MSTAAVGSALIDAFNAHNLEGWSAKLAPGFEANYPGGRALDAAHARGFNQAFLTAFPDLHFERQRAFASDTETAIEWRASGTHTGPLATPTGQTIAPTGKRISESGVLIAEVRNGRIVRETTYWNLASLLAQLG